jgi:hypothetical protein
MLKYTDTDIDEDMKLTRSDYLKILHHYQPRTRKGSLSANTKAKTATLKKRAHRILAEKLCRCVKPSALSSSDERGRIAYCTRSIFTNRCLRPHGFRCKSVGVTRHARRESTLRPRITRDITKTCHRLRL